MHLHDFSVEPMQIQCSVFHRATPDIGEHEPTLHSWSNPAEYCGFNMAKYASKIHAEPIKEERNVSSIQTFKARASTVYGFISSLIFSHSGHSN